MPKEKASLTMKDPARETVFYYAVVPTALLKKVEARRKILHHNKTGAVIAMMELYLKESAEGLKP